VFLVGQDSRPLLPIGWRICKSKLHDIGKTQTACQSTFVVGELLQCDKLWFQKQGDEQHLFAYFFHINRNDLYLELEFVCFFSQKF
jgi:hypothetical protein